MVSVNQEIWHGDSRELVEKVPEGVNCVITDPPYGVNYRSRHAVTPEGLKYVADVAHDSDLLQARGLFLDVMAGLLPRTADECEMYVFTRWDIVGDWIDTVRELSEFGFAYKMMLIWDKGGPGTGDIDANWGCGHEIILYLKKGRRDVKFRRSGIISVDMVHPHKIVHPTEKPVPLLTQLIEMSTSPGDLIVDPFSGSGSTAVAAQKTGRRAVGIELEERYADIGNHRLGAQAFDF